MAIALDFKLLDELTLAAIHRRMDVSSSLRSQFVCVTLGPLMEMEILRRSGIGGFPDIAAISTSDCTITLATALANNGDPVERRRLIECVGFLRVSRDPDAVERDPRWILFCRRAQEAFEAAGFTKRRAQGLVAAFRELEDNIHRHSENASSGIVGYRSANGTIEFVSADSGIGVLKSLRTCPTYADVDDAGRALRLALSEGASRYGPGTGHGTGFNSLFTGVANLNGFLRFRSDDHVLSVDGTVQSLAKDMMHIFQRPALSGFTASITCKT